MGQHLKTALRRSNYVIGFRTHLMSVPLLAPFRSFPFPFSSTSSAFRVSTEIFLQFKIKIFKLKDRMTCLARRARNHPKRTQPLYEEEKMGKKKSRKQNTDQIAKQQLHGTISGSVKKNKDPKFKKTPIGKVALINNSKIQKKEVKSVSSEKNAQKSNVNAENKNQDLPKKAFKDSVKPSSSNGGQSLSSKAKNESFKGKYICKLDEMLELINDSDSYISEETSQEDSSLNESDIDIDIQDTDIQDIFGKSFKDESDEDDEDYEMNLDEEEDDEDNDEEGKVKYKGVKMFRGLRSNAKKNKSNEENGKLVQTGIGLDNYESSSSDDFMDFIDSDEYKDRHEYYVEEYKNKIQNKNANKTGTSMEIDEVDKDEDDDDDDSEVDVDEDDDDDNDDDDDDDDSDSADEEVGLKALLGKSIADDDDDKDFNEEDEDDEDDDISSEDEDDENNIVEQVKDYNDDDDDDDKDFNKDDEDYDSSDDISSEYDEENNTVKQIKGKEKREEAINQKGIREFKFMTPKIKQRYEEEMQRKIVIVQNISKDATRDKMIELFRQYGGLKEMSLTPLTVIKTIGDNGTSIVAPGTLHKLLSLEGRFLYATEKSAQDAVKALHGKMVDGHYLCVQTLVQFNGPYNLDKCVFITNLKKDVKLNDIWKAFLKYGDIVCIELIRNNETKECKNGYVQFYTKEAVASVFNSSNTIKVKGRQVTVSKPKYQKEAMIMYRETKMKDQSVTEENEREFFKGMLEQITNDQIAQKHASPKAVLVHSKENIKKLQGRNEEKKSTVFQGQKVHLKSKKKKKKSKLDKKRKEMAKKLTAKSAKV